MAILSATQILASGTMVRLNGGFRAEVISHVPAEGGNAAVHTFLIKEKLVRKNGTRYLWKPVTEKQVTVNYTAVIEIYTE